MRDIFHYWHYQVLTIQPTNPLLIENLPSEYRIVSLQLIQFKMPKVMGYGYMGSIPDQGWAYWSGSRAKFRRFL